MKRLCTILLLTLATPLAAALPMAVDGQQLPTLAPMLERATPAVVNIATRGKSRRRIELPLQNDPFFRRFFDLPEPDPNQQAPRKRQQSAGSGVIVDADEDRWGDEDFVPRVDRCGGQDEASDQTESHPVG